MTTKQQILEVVNDLPEDARYDEVIDRLYLLRKVEIGLSQADRGEVIPHKDLLKELFNEDKA